MKTFQAVRLSVVVSVACLFSAESFGGGYSTARFGGEHGHAATDHPTATYFNPAGIVLGDRTRVYAEGLFVFRTASYDRPAEAVDNLGTGTPDDPTAIAANSGRAELGNFLVSPFLGVVSDLGTDSAAIGLSVYAPFGGQASWGQNDQFADSGEYPGAYDGSQRWSTIEGAQRALFVTLAGAYRLPGPRLSVGAGINLVSQSMSVLRARNVDGSDDLVSPVGLAEGRTLFEGSDTSVSLGVGVMWEASDALRVGLSYQSMPGFGENALSGTLTSKFGAGAEGEVASTMLLSLPDSVRAGLVYRVSPRLELRFSGDYTRWSVFERHCLLSDQVEGAQCVIAADGSVDEAGGGSGVLLAIPRDWNDTFGVRAGGSYWVKGDLEAFGGVGFDSNAVPDETLDAGLMDMNKIVTSAGLGMNMLGGALRLTGSITNVLYFSRDVAVRDPADIPELPSRSPDNAGTYTQSVNLFTMGAQYAF
jgi:long-chain fatty acid transport protein